MTDVIDEVDGDSVLKAEHRAIWAPGDYPALAAAVIPDFCPPYAGSTQPPPMLGSRDHVRTLLGARGRLPGHRRGAGEGRGTRP